MIFGHTTRAISFVRKVEPIFWGKLVNHLRVQWVDEIIRFIERIERKDNELQNKYFQPSWLNHDVQP